VLQEKLAPAFVLAAIMSRPPLLSSVWFRAVRMDAWEYLERPTSSLHQVLPPRAGDDSVEARRVNQAVESLYAGLAAC